MRQADDIHGLRQAKCRAHGNDHFILLRTLSGLANFRQKNRRLAALWFAAKLMLSVRERRRAYRWFAFRTARLRLSGAAAFH